MAEAWPVYSHIRSCSGNGIHCCLTVQAHRAAAPDMLQPTMQEALLLPPGWNALVCGVQFGSYLAGPGFPLGQNLTRGNRPAIALI